MKPSLNTPTYTLFKDLHEGDFIFVYPSNLEMTQYGWEECIVMLPRMGMTSIIEFGACSKLQWWVPYKRRECNNVNFYKDYWQGRWKCNLVNPMQWVDINSIIFLFLARKNIPMNITITISDVHGNLIKINIDVANELNYIWYIKFWQSWQLKWFFSWFFF